MMKYWSIKKITKINFFSYFRKLIFFVLEQGIMLLHFVSRTNLNFTVKKKIRNQVKDDSDLLINYEN